MKLFRFLALLPLALGVACAPTQDSVNVNVFHLNDLKEIKKDNPMMRAEQQKRLYGAVTLAEKQDRMGHYYAVRWDVSKSAPTDSVRVVFSYRQAATASKVHRQVVEAGRQVKGFCEFQVTGDSFREKGNVLSWKVQVYAGEKQLVSEQSYMWE